MGGGWDEDAIEQERRWLDAAAEHGLHGWVNLRELSSIRPGETEKEAKLRAIIERFKDHPGLGLWKNYDEAAWNRQPVEAMLRGYRIIPFPARCGRGPWLRMPVSVLYEAPRTITARGGSFTDWFGAFEVHVYRFRRS